MTHARPLLPYALVSVAIVVASTALVATTFRLQTSAIRSGAPVTNVSEALPNDVRLAYWRESPDGRWDLWVSDLEGRRRWSIARETDIEEISVTAWHPDGEAVAYVRELAEVAVVPLVGASTVLAMPTGLRAEAFGVVALEWSPEGEKIAATLRDGRGASREGDVWVVDLVDATWTRVTELGDGLAGPWVSKDELLVESGSGFIGIARVSHPTAVRPITGMRAVSPRIGKDGRLYVAGGRGVGQPTTLRPTAQGAIWSMALDGSDVRRETARDDNEIRLTGWWTDGSFVIEQAGDPKVVGRTNLTLPWAAGRIRRIETVAKRDDAIGFTFDRVLRIDPQTLSPADIGPPSGVTVLLDGVRHAALWQPPAEIDPIRSGMASAPAPFPAAFVLGNSLWLMDEDGSLRQAIPAKPNQWLSLPKWSPTGEHLAVVANGRDATLRGRVQRLLILDRSGEQVAELPGGDVPTWSSDGRGLAVTIWDSGVPEIWQQWVDRPGVVERSEGSSAIWTDQGIFVVTGGEMDPVTRHQVGERIELWTNGVRRTITSATDIAAHVFRVLGADAPQLLLESLTAPADGRYVGVSTRALWRPGEAPSNDLVVIRPSDGAILNVIPAPEPFGSTGEWSPRGHLIARNAGPFQPTNPENLGLGTSQAAEVVDALTGRVLARAEGEFAGWTWDGRTWYVARPQGLFAYDVEGGAGVLVSPYGVRFSIAPR